MSRRLPISQTRERLHQKCVLGRSHREVAASLGVSVGLVAKLATRAARLGLDGAELERLPDEALESRLYAARRGSRVTRPVPRWSDVDLALRRPGATLEKVHREYLREHPTGYQYSRFCAFYRAWSERHRRAGRRVHRAAESLFTRHARLGPWLLEPSGGAPRRGALFLGSLGASDYTFAEVTRSRDEADVIASHVRALAFFAGVPRSIIHEQHGVEGGTSRAFLGLARHYRTTMLPEGWSEPRRPAAVLERWLGLHFERWPPLTLEEANTRVAERVLLFNRRVLRLHGESRATLFESLERPALSPLPVSSFAYSRWHRVHVDAVRMVRVEGASYAVPPGLEEQPVEVCITAHTVEVFHQGARVAVHTRLSPAPG